MGTRSVFDAKNLRAQLGRIIDYVRKNLRFVETDLDVSGSVNIKGDTFNFKPDDSSGTGASILAASNSQVVVNEASNDVDFRVESDAATHMLFVDGGNNRVSIGSSVDAPAAAFEVQSPATAGVPAVIIDNDDTDQFALQINAANIDASAMLIDADALTTAHAINITADALTTGSILNLVSNSAQTNARSLVTIKNDNTAATATTLLHLINDSTSASADMILESTDADAAAAPIIEFRRNSASPAVDDVMGKILFNGKDDAGNTTLYASMRAEINDETDSGGQEDGVIVFDVIKNNSQKSVLELKNNEAVFNNAGADIDFRIESDDETHMFYIDANENRISIGDSTDTPAATLEVTNHASAGATGAPLVQLNSNDTDQIAVDINAANIDADVIDIAADAVTTAFVMDVTADALTTGGVINITSNSSNTGDTRSLIKVLQDHASAGQVHLLHLKNDAQTSAFSEATALIEHGGGGHGLELRFTGTATGKENSLVLSRTDTTSEADDMNLGLIAFHGANDNNDIHRYIQILGEASDVSDGDEGGKLTFTVASGGTAGTSALNELFTIGGEDVTNTVVPAVVVNEAGINCDFRVESNDETHMLFVDGSQNAIGIGTNDPDSGILHIHNDSHTHAEQGVAIVFIDQDVNTAANGGACFQIGTNSNPAANTEAPTMVVFADLLTTADVLQVSADALTTGGILNLVSNSSNTSDRTLVTVKNDNTAATGTVVMHLINDAIGGSGDPILLIESTADETNAILELRNSNASTTGEPIIRFVRSDTSAEADDMDLGRIHFDGSDDGNNLTTFATILAEASDITGGTESGKVSLTAMNAGTERSFINYGGEDTNASTPAEVVINEGSIDIDFRVESNATTHALFVDGGSDHVRIDAAQGLHLKDLGGHANTPASGFGVIYVNGDVPYFKTDGGTATSMIAGGGASAPLTLTNASDSGSPALTIDNNDTDQIALSIDAANIDADVIDITADAVTTAFVMDVTADALTTGGILNLVSDSSDTSDRTLVTVKNDNTAAVGTVVMHLINDAIGGLDDPTLLIESTANETHPVLELRNSNASTTSEPILIFTNPDDTAEADDMKLGQIQFKGVDSGNNATFYAQIKADATDITAGDEGGEIKFVVMAGGTAGTAAVKELLTIGGEDVANTVVPAVVINEAGINCDFRVEGDTETHLIFADASVDRVSIGASTDAPAATLEVTNASDAGVPLFQLNNTDVDQEALQIVAANTTGGVFGITADSLTTGKAVVVYSNSNSGSERDLIRVRNDNTGADATTLLRLMNDADPDDTPEGASMVIEHTFSTNNRNNLALTSTSSTGTASAALSFQKTTTSEADDMILGIIRFQGKNSNNDLHEYGGILVRASDVTDGDEGGKMEFIVHAGGTAGTAGFKELFTIGGEDVANGIIPAVVVNEDGINCDFRVESDGEDEAIFLDASAEELHINKGESAFTTHIYNTNDVAMSVTAAGVIFNEDGHATNNFRVESDNLSVAFGVDAGDDTIAAGGNDSSNHKDGFAVFNDFNATTFENKLASGKFGSGEVLRYSPGADDTLGAGKLFFLHTDGTWDAVDASAVATGATQLLGVGLGGSARTVGCMIKGFIRIPSGEILNLPGSGACDGLPLYVSTTAGHFDFSPPQANDDFVRIVGYAIDDDSSDVLIYFNPDSTHVEITA